VIFAAHSKPGATEAELHPLEVHLREVGRIAAEFAGPFGASDWAKLAGLWHDLGKYRPGFQKYLRLTSDAHIEGRISGNDKTHSAAGAWHALKTLEPDYGRVLAYLIAGHHAGLPDWDNGTAASLRARTAEQNLESSREYQEALAQPIPGDICKCTPLSPPGDAARAGFALWLRMLFSCLVDADFLDTETYFDTEKAVRRKIALSADKTTSVMKEMKRVLDAHLVEMTRHARANGMSSVNARRAEVLAACREKALLPPGFFTLTVPTGGGKSLSSLAFALEHALAHRKRRVIYAIPYTSIIEQNARVFRDVFAALGDDVIVEHHSNLDVNDRSEDHANRLAAENWDAPLIVTTNVQLFESLHAARTSRCRKLHNLVDSVIILDEAQMLPREYLAPVLSALKLLVLHYGVSVVLCTATQPALGSRYEAVSNRLLLDGIDEVQPIIASPAPLFHALKRVEIHFPDDVKAHEAWADIAKRIAGHDCVLAIVNTRSDARDLFKLLPAEGAEHLSALMCAEHRAAVIERIKCRLASRRAGDDSQPLRVVSTQLVEAGVDFSFPVVFRALAGMDSIAQAAGRCNREGELEGFGHVYVFVPPKDAPPGFLRQAAQSTTVLAASGKLRDPLAPETFVSYFNELYGRQAGDFGKAEILDALTWERAEFRTVAEKFRLIDEAGETIIVPYSPDGENAHSPVHGWLGALEKDGNAKWARRKLQRFTVTVPQHQFAQLLAQHDIEERAGLWAAVDSRYQNTFGLLGSDDLPPAKALVI
jgi:CRISPR-associated endonuclease/helicase Cas3